MLPKHRLMQTLKVKKIVPNLYRMPLTLRSRTIRLHFSLLVFIKYQIRFIADSIHHQKKREECLRVAGTGVLGSRKGNKPKIVLPQNSSRFDNKDKPKIAINLHQTFYEIDCIFNLQMISNISNLIHFKFIELKMTKRSPSKFSSEYNLYSTLIVLLLFPTLKICLYKFSELHSIKTGVSFSAIK